MNISGIVTDIKEKIIGCRDRIPLILLAASILSGILNTVLYLTAAVFGTSQFVLLLNRITTVIAVIGSVCGFLLGLYLLILFKKTKSVWLAVAGAAFVISPVLSLFTIGNTGRAAAIGAVQWVLSLAASLALSAYEYGRGGRKAKDLGIAGFIVTAVQSFLNVIMTASAQKLYEVAGGRLLYLLQALTIAAGLVNTLIHLATICTASDAAGGVMDVVSSVLSTPAPTYLKDYRLPASYTNFLIMNDAVLVPSYKSPNDRVVKARLKKAFPGREVRMIDCRALLSGHGSLHCITMNFPEGYLRY